MPTTISRAAMAGLLLAVSAPSLADTLDDVIAAKLLRCAVVLDFPPIGYRGAGGEPAGFDVDYCKDLAAAIGVAYEIVPVDWAGRLPAITEGKADVVFAGTSDTLERAKTVGFTIPYAIYYAQAVVHRDSGIRSFEDMRGKRVAAASGTVQEREFLKYARAWGTEHLYRGYGSENAVVLAVAESRADAGITASTAVGPFVRRHETVIAGPRMPWTTHYTSVAGPRKDVSWLNYLNLFITHQVRSGRYGELWRKHVGTEPPELRIPGVHY